MQYKIFLSATKLGHWDVLCPNGRYRVIKNLETRGRTKYVAHPRERRGHSVAYGTLRRAGAKGWVIE